MKHKTANDYSILWMTRTLVRNARKKKTTKIVHCRWKRVRRKWIIGKRQKCERWDEMKEANERYENDNATESLQYVSTQRGKKNKWNEIYNEEEQKAHLFKLNRSAKSSSVAHFLLVLLCFFLVNCFFFFFSSIFLELFSWTTISYFHYLHTN